MGTEQQGSPRGASAEGSTERVRREKLERLRAEGIDPYPRAGFPDRDKISAIHDAHRPEQLEEGEQEGFSYRIAGRVVGRRGHGKTIFLDIRDLTGQVQAYARVDSLGEEAFGRIDALDIGDEIGVEGDLYVTKRGQLALAVRECTMLAKALRDPPDLFHGISDPEVRYRRRELDLIANERSREIFAMRAKLVAAIRAYLNERDFVELETPILQTLAGGAAARPFTTHHHSLGRELFLRTATELYLKRAIVGGFENVYELSRFFRNEGLSPQHNPEFTMLEWFHACIGYEDLMTFAEQMIATVVEQVTGSTKVERGGKTIDFKAPWKRVSLRQAVLEETGADICAASRDELAELLEDDVDPKADWAWIVDEIQGKLIEPKLIQPTFLVDLPRELWPTVKPQPDYPELLGEAFDGVVDGMEIIGGGTDTNDADMQRESFVRQRQRRHAESEEAPYPSDDEYVRALEYGSLPASGSGIGIDRLTMIVAGVDNLRDVILFPSMRQVADPDRGSA
ncbi:MAG TPA: lysine--tRNA ligase [Solirubrobacterales bacterium]|nr:lysine--tRNA ligase [Solirubrobacterales bacterium]